jgi:DnaK suppressor protein
MLTATRDLKQMRTALERERRTLAAQASTLAGHARISNDETSTEDADVATSLHDRELDIWLEHRARSHLSEVDAAVARMETGRYGICDECHEEIDPQRLRALPRASKCVSCQRKTEVRSRRSRPIADANYRS